MVCAVLAGLVLAVSAGPLGGEALAVDGSPAVSPNAAPAAASPPNKAPITVVPTPCNKRSDGACTAAPRTLVVTFGSGSAVPDGVTVTWTTTGRPTATPGPAQSSVFLNKVDGGCHPATGAVTCTWPWPTGLEAPGSIVVLNGTYQVAPCSAPPSPGTRVC
ncbi:MAG: hypothetical protein M3137_13295, partial [Actinomycetota bacterium]|nr:hypothetical protein [Actinomycetota bacterium]